MNDIDFTKPNVYIALTEPEKYANARINLVMKFCKLKGIYVTLNTPFTIMDKTLKDAGINTSNMFFIDGISGKSNDEARVAYVEDPRSLTALSIKISESANLKDYEFLILDSASAMLVYNEVQMTEQFLYYVINKLRVLEFKGVIVVINDERSRQALNTIIQVSDRIINI